VIKINQEHSSNVRRQYIQFDPIVHALIGIHMNIAVSSINSTMYTMWNDFEIIINCMYIIDWRKYDWIVSFLNIDLFIVVHWSCCLLLVQKRNSDKYSHAQNTFILRTSVFLVHPIRWVSLQRTCHDRQAVLHSMSIAIFMNRSSLLTMNIISILAKYFSWIVVDYF
jgi:hypothetical protein